MLDVDKLSLDQYQQEAGKTAIYPAEWGFPYTVMGLVGEAGEVAQHLKKVIRDDGGEITPERRSLLIDELGDVLWYAAMTAKELGVSLEQVAQRNLIKLQHRQERNQLKGDGDER